MADVEIPREQLPTKFQLRAKIGQIDAWRAAAKASGEGLSSWIRRVCDATAAGALTPVERHAPDGALTPALAEGAPAVSTERPVPPNPADTARDPTPTLSTEELLKYGGRNPPLASNCVNGNYHWRLKSGERCLSCGGVA